MIGIQNHKDMFQTGDQCIKILKAIDFKWVGIIVNTGKFNTKDPYRDIEMVTPFAVNWKVKESVFDGNRDLTTDYTRLIQILNKYNYRGYLPIETLEIKEVPYEPFVLVQIIITELNDAIKLEEKDQ